MSDKKNIDRLFQEKFKDFEIAPNDAVWNRINESLPKKKKKRRVIALWWQIGGVAAVIAILLTIGVSIFNSNDDNNQEFPIVSTDKTDTENIQGEEKINNSAQDKLSNEADRIKFVDSDTNNENTIEEQENIAPKRGNTSSQLTSSNTTKLNTVVANKSNEKEKTSSSQKRNSITSVSNEDNITKIATNTKTTLTNSKNSDDSQLETETEIKSLIKKTIEENKTAITENSSSNNSESNTTDSEIKNRDDSKTENSIIEDPKKQSITNAIVENTKTIDEKEEDKQNRWSIAPNVAPVYYSSLGQGSALDKQFNENSKNGNINMSYGIVGSYAISKKLKLRGGVNRVNLSQTTSDVYAFTGAETAARGIDAQFGNIKFKEDIPTISLMSSKMLDMTSAPEVFNTKIAGDIDQKFGFIEVPLELEYRLVDKKFGINVIGGFSTFFLSNNEIYADIEGVSTLIGEANNINDTSFSANLGLGMDYKLSKQWNINLEPTFKYQINTFNNTSGDFKPFFVGVYTGLSYKF